MCATPSDLRCCISTDVDYFLHPLSLRITAPDGPAALRLCFLAQFDDRSVHARGMSLAISQATRGVAPRDHKFPSRIRTLLFRDGAAAEGRLRRVCSKGRERIVSIPAIPAGTRWRHQSLSLLPSVGQQDGVRGRWPYEAFCQIEIARASLTEGTIERMPGSRQSHDGRGAL